MNLFVSLRVSSVALLVAACGGGGNGGSSATGDQNLGGAESGGAGGDAAGSEPGPSDSLGGNGGENAGGTAGGGGSAGSGGTSAGGNGVGGSGPAGSGGSGGVDDDDAGVAGSGGVAGNGGDTDGGGGMAGGGGVAGSGGSDTDAGPTLVAPPPAGIVAFAYAGDAVSTTPYELDAAYRYHADGGTVTSERTGVGTYTVTASGLTVPMRNVQVTAYDQAAYCGVSTFGNTSAEVRCYDFEGAPVNARFSLLALGPEKTTATFMAYTWANDDATAQYTPEAAYAYNAGGGAVTARRTVEGIYSVEFAGLSLAAGNVQVTTFGGDKHCNVNSWSNSSIHVRCYDASGALADARYQVLLSKHSTNSRVVLGYATTVTAADPGGDLSASGYTFNAAGGTTTATKNGTGSYLVRFEGTTLDGGNVQVAPVASNEYCHVGLFADDMVSIRCYDADGMAQDSRFSVVAIR